MAVVRPWSAVRPMPGVGMEWTVEWAANPDGCIDGRHVLKATVGGSGLGLEIAQPVELVRDTESNFCNKDFNNILVSSLMWYILYHNTGLILGSG
ncbi:hypothetical protein Tco_0581835 [Tanacetum coccineum]